MLINKKLTFEGIWLFARKTILQTFALSTIVVMLYQFVDLKILAIPFLPVATIGTAVAFYVGFKIIRHTTDYGKPGGCGVELQIPVEF